MYSRIAKISARKGNVKINKTQTLPKTTSNTLLNILNVFKQLGCLTAEIFLHNCHALQYVHLSTDETQAFVVWVPQVLFFFFFLTNYPTFLSCKISVVFCFVFPSCNSLLLSMVFTRSLPNVRLQFQLLYILCEGMLSFPWLCLIMRQNLINTSSVGMFCHASCII